MGRFPEIDLVEESLERCLSKEGFVSQFYFELCNIHPAPYCLLSGPKLETYKKNLNSVLKGLLEYGKGLPSGEKNLLSMANLETGITQDTIAYWEEALIIAITSNDEKLDQETSQAWRSLIKMGLDFILSQRNLKLAA
jgi:hypothetical protein